MAPNKKTSAIKHPQPLGRKLTPMPPIESFFHIKDGKIVHRASAELLKSLEIHKRWKASGYHRAAKIPKNPPPNQDQNQNDPQPQPQPIAGSSKQIPKAK